MCSESGEPPSAALPSGRRAGLGMGADAPATCAMGVGEAGRGAGAGDQQSLVKRGDESFYPWAVLGG